MALVLVVTCSFAAPNAPLQSQLAAAEQGPPQVGESASNFNLLSVDGQSVHLAAQLAEGPIVLLVLRGYPGYQCPVCSRQVGQYLAQAARFAAQNARVVMVYPGPSGELKARAEEFIEGKTLPKGFVLALDPDYTFTQAYNLRWEAKNETAYPSTFVIGKDGKVRFAKISRTHGDRTTPADVLAALAEK